MPRESHWEIHNTKSFVFQTCQYFTDLFKIYIDFQYKTIHLSY